MKKQLFIMIIGLLFSSVGFAETKPSKMQSDNQITVYRSASCGCCKGWIAHLEENGFKVNDKVSQEISAIKDSLQIPEDIRSCHTGMIAGYIIEGHVPAADIKKLLQGKSAVQGIAVPGMVIGSPGMEYEGRKDPYEVVSYDSQGNIKTFSRYNY